MKRDNRFWLIATAGLVLCFGGLILFLLNIVKGKVFLSILGALLFLAGLAALLYLFVFQRPKAGEDGEGEEPINWKQLFVDTFTGIGAAFKNLPTTFKNLGAKIKGILPWVKKDEAEEDEADDEESEEAAEAEESSEETKTQVIEKVDFDEIDPVAELEAKRIMAEAEARVDAEEAA